MVAHFTNQITTEGSFHLANVVTSLEEEFTHLLGWQDLVIRALRNPKFSPVYLRLYLSLIDTYPQLLDGKKAEIEVWKVRANAGEVKESSATRFFQDMATIQAIVYEPTYDKKSGNRRSFVTPLPDFDIPENFDTNSTDRKRKAKELEEKRRNQFKDPRKLEQCEECGSNDIYFDVTPYCASCGHVHRTLKDIPAKDIVIEAEVIEVQDNFLDETTTPRLAIVKAAPVQLPMTPAPASVGKHPRGIACPDCQARNHWRAEDTSWGGTIYICAICSPE